jgi:hypothetical protein
MLSLLRRSSRLVAPVAVALAAMVLVGTTDWWHANDADDLAPARVHDHAGHHPLLKAKRTTDSRPSEHCYLCHWLRSFQNGLRTQSTHALATVRTPHVQSIATSAPLHTVATLLPARAPPV